MLSVDTDKRVINAKQKPTVWYGLHFYEGPAEYREPGKQPYRILVNEQTLRDMDPTFEGCPVYVRHKEEVNLDKLQEEADGYVISSFYNKSDGKHWCKFIVVSDKGHEAIRNGWTLSNAYVPTGFGPGGIWNGIEYVKEITRGKFEHLAIVPDPRYQESIVLTPTQFQEYNENQNIALQKVANAKETSKVANLLNLFKKTEVKDLDTENTIVKLKNGKEVTIAQLINAADQEHDEEKKAEEKKKENEGKESKATEPTEEHAEHKASEDKSGDKKSEEEEEKQGHKEEEKGAAPQMANMDHHVTVGNKTMSVKQMYDEHSAMKKHFQDFSHFVKSYSNDEQMDGGEKDAAKAKEADLTKTNADLDGGEKEAKGQEASADKTKRNSEDGPKATTPHFDKLANAHLISFDNDPIVDLSTTARGKAKYGSDRF